MRCLRPPISFTARSFRATFLLLLAALYGCGESVSGGDQTILNDAVLINGATLRVNNVTGSDSGDGIIEPFRTLQYALDQLRPGDVLLVETSGLSYSTTAVIGEERDENDVVTRILQGFVLSNSGSPSSPITITGDAINKPVIDQQQSGSVPGVAVLGLLLDCTSHVVVENLEIRNTNEAGISSSTTGACETSNVTIRNNEIHNVTGEKYVGGVRMMGVSDLHVADNRISDIFSNKTPEEKVLYNPGRGVSYVLVENNQFENVETGVAINAQGLGNITYTLNAEEVVSGVQVSHNLFNGVDRGIQLDAHISDDSSTDELLTGKFSDIDIYGNVFDEGDSALVTSLGSSFHQSSDICVFNNTIVDALSTNFVIDGVIALEFFNNIHHSPAAEVLVTQSPSNAALQNTIDYSDHNLFWNAGSLSWRLDSGGPVDMTYTGLANWQANIALATNPDLLSLVQDPLFSDYINADYQLAAASPALSSGRFGMSRGADFEFPDLSATAGNACMQRVL